MNIADVKRELSGDEKVLESAFKLETLYKKYKVIIWIVILGIVLFFIGKTVIQSLHESQLEEANNAYLTLQKNPEDTTALAILKEKNVALFELYTYAQASKKEDLKSLQSLVASSNPVIADASAYSVGTLENRPRDSILYKEMAILEEAYLAIQSGEMKRAKEKLALIDEKSQLSKIALFLAHLTIKGK